MSALGDYITVPEMARRLGISRQAVHKLVQLGRVKADKIGRDWLIREPEIMLPANATKRPIRRGFSLVEVALSIGLAGVALAFLEQGADDASRQVKDAAVADRLKEVYSAATAYVAANPGLVSSIPVGGSISLPVAKTTAAGAVPANSLQSGGYLPSTFVDSNAYHQSSAVIIRQPSAGNIEALVTTVGGDTISDVDLGRIAAKVGADGGVVDSNPPPGINAGTMLGVGGGWQEPASNWTTAGITPMAGHAVAVNYASQVNALQDFLYRNNIGIAEANRMHTAIDMTHNALNSVGTINNTDQSTGADAPITVGSSLQGTGGGAVSVQNGLQACAAGTTGCDVALGAQTGLADENDGWLSAYNTNSGKGFHVQSNGGKGGALSVDGTSTLTGTVITGNGVQMQAGGTITWPGQNGTSSYLGPDNALAGYLEVYGSLHASTELQAPKVYASNLMEGNVVQADSYAISPIYYDKNNSSYYLIPSGNSNLYNVYAQFVQSNSGVYANPNGTRNVTDFYAPGFQVWEDSNGATDEALNGALTVNGNETVGGNLSVNGSETVAGTAQANGLITTMKASAAAACSVAGEIAQDTSGHGIDTCTDGVWTNDIQFSHEVVFSDNAGGLTSGQTIAFYSAAHANPSATSPMWCHADSQNANPNFAVREEAFAAGSEAGNTAGYEDTTVAFFVQPSQSFYIYESANWDGATDNGGASNFGTGISTFCWY